ncbi:hypothetical protein [Alistipes dispar]|uniref:hypothetical protein n=1 Tax=Alistipes dispar TaxID=2585119 RepID=UPI003A83B485
MPTNDYDELIKGMAKGSRPRPKPRGRKKEIDFVCKKSIDFTNEAWEIIQKRIAQTHGNPRKVIYESLELLAQKYGL